MKPSRHLAFRVALAASLALTAAPVASQSETRITEFARGVDDLAERELRVFDLRELLTAQEIGTDPKVARSVLLEKRRDRVAQIATACATFIDPPLEGEESIQGIGSSHLACIGSAQQQEWIRRFLALQIASYDMQLMLEARILTVPPRIYATLDLMDGPRALTPDETEALLRRLDDAKVETLVAPRVLVFGLSKFSIETSSQVSFVRDYELQSHGEGDSAVFIADPVIDVVQDGISLGGMLARLDEDRIGLQCTFELAEIERPIPIREVVLDEKIAAVKIQKPTVHRVAVDATAAGKGRHAILFPAPEFRGNHPVVILMPSLVPPIKDR